MSGKYEADRRRWDEAANEGRDLAAHIKSVGLPIHEEFFWTGLFAKLDPVSRKGFIRAARRHVEHERNIGLKRAVYAVYWLAALFSLAIAFTAPWLAMRIGFGAAAWFSFVVIIKTIFPHSMRTWRGWIFMPLGFVKLAVMYVAGGFR